MRKIKNPKLIPAYIFVLAIVLWSGRGNSFVRNFYSLIIPDILGIYLLFKYRIGFSNKLIKFYIVFFIYVFINAIVEDGFFPLFIFRYISLFFLAYVAVNIPRNKFFELFENVVFKLVVLSLILYPVLLFNYYGFYQLLSKFAIGGISESEVHQKTAGIFFYVIEYDSRALIPRNCGFTWEPGPFSGFIVVAMSVSLIINKMKVNFKRMFIYLLALITTMSTTGFISFFILVIWYGSHLKKKYFYIIPIIGIFVLLFVNIPFLGDKVETEMLHTEKVNQMIKNTRYGSTYSPGRFVSFQIALLEFYKRPFIGYGGHWEGQTFAHYISIVNGFGIILARFGLFGAFLFIFLTIRSMRELSYTFNFKHWFLLALIFFSISWGFGIVQSSLFFSFEFYYVLKNKEII